MAETYEILFDGKCVGTVQMEKQGLYRRFSCRCRLPEEGLYRIHAVCGEAREDLGICVPLEGSFGMDKKIPAKRLGEGEISFELLPKDWQPPAENAPEPEPEIEEQPAPVAGEQTDPSTAGEVAEPAKEVEPAEEAEPAGERFVPVSEEEPFDELDCLEEAVLTERDGQLGILISETQD